MAKASPSGPGTGFAIGIDLGTTYSCAAIYRDGVVTIIKNELGKATTPSHIAFPDLTQSVASLRTPPPVTVGDAAKYQADVNPENSIYDVKRLIGRRFDDPVLQKDIKHWPFKVVEDNNSPRVHVNGKTYHPEQISAKVLAYLKQQAEMFLGGPVTDAVITVPAYFNDGQRQATKDAGSIAGLNVLRIINEPTAAAIAYNHQLREQLGGSEPIKRKNVLIFDLGGGTFDLALLTMEGNTINVKAVDGDTHLGGQDFDNAMMDHCIQEFKTKHNVDLSQCQEDTAKGRFELNRRLRRIKNECERKKENLSGANFVQISVEVIYGGLDLNMRFKKTTFESINQQLFDRCIEIVDRTLKGAKMSTEEIDDVVLVGGSSRIPKIQTMLKDYFKGKAPCQNIKQDEAVAYGAAVQAGQMTASPKDGDKTLIKLPNKFSSDVIFTDVIPHSIGIEIHVEEGNVNNFSVIIDKNTTVPCKKMKEFSTVYDNQESCTIAIFEGESPSVADNHQLGEFELENLPPNRPKGEPIHVHMEMNDEGILKVTAECPANKVRKDISVKALKGRLKPDEVLRLKMEELFLTSTTSVWGTFTD